MTRAEIALAYLLAYAACALIKGLEGAQRLARPLPAIAHEAPPTLPSASLRRAQADAYLCAQDYVMGWYEGSALDPVRIVYDLETGKATVWRADLPPSEALVAVGYRREVAERLLAGVAL